MPIFPGSRYEGEPFVGLTTKKGRTAKWLEMRQRVTVAAIGDDFRVYTVQDGDVPDMICFKFGFPTRLWWLVADVNDLPEMFTLERGQQLKIPSAAEFGKR